MKSPKSIKISLAVLLVCCMMCVVFVTLGCQGPGREYIIRMHERADLHFPRYQYFLGSASSEDLENILKKEKGAYKKASPEILDFLRSSLKKELDAWKYLIDTNFKLLGDQK